MPTQQRIKQSVVSSTVDGLVFYSQFFILHFAFAIQWKDGKTPRPQLTANHGLLTIALLLLFSPHHDSAGDLDRLPAIQGGERLS